MKRLAILSAAGLLAGCSNFMSTDIADYSCQDVERLVVELSQGQLIKILGDQETSRTETSLICHGTGVYSDNSEVRTRYRVYIDSEGDFMYAYDVDEAIESEWRQIEAEAQREAARAVREFENAMSAYGY